jgi:hypothetical protein
VKTAMIFFWANAAVHHRSARRNAGIQGPVPLPASPARLKGGAQDELVSVLF